MELVKFDGVGAVLRAVPADCAALARLCERAADSLQSIEDEPLAEMSRTYAALFRACTLGGMTPGNLLAEDHAHMREDLATLGLADLLAPRPGAGPERD